MDWHNEIEIIEIELQEHINSLEKKFIQSYLPPKVEDTPDVFGHMVQAFCLLSHAAFEHFIERISQSMANYAIDNYICRSEVNSCLLSLCLFYKIDIQAAAEKDEQSTNLDLLRKALNEAKRIHGQAIFGNHGFSLEYLRKSLTPIGINIPKETRLESSLKVLTDARGTYAHTLAKGANYYEDKGKAKTPKILVPEDARSTAADCLELCLSISKQIKGMFPVAVVQPSLRSLRITRWRNRKSEASIKKSSRKKKKFGVRL